MWLAKDKKTGKYWREPLWPCHTPFGSWWKNIITATHFKTQAEVEKATSMEPEGIVYLEIK